MRAKRAIAIDSCTGALLAMNVGMATAGEITGNGKFLEMNGKSICSFSGLNDDPEGEDPANGPPGRTQSYGQDVRMGMFEPAQFNPGDACNPNAGGH